MIPSVSGTIKTNHLAFGCDRGTKKSKEKIAVDTTFVAGGTGVAAKAGDSICKIAGNASKVVNELGSTARNAAKTEKMVDRNAIVKFFEKFMGHSKLARKFIAPVAGVFGGGLAIATGFTNALNTINTLPKLSFVKALEKKN